MEINDPICSVQGLYAYTSADPASLSFGQGDVIHVLAKLESGWWDGWCNGRRGWFPSNYVEEIITHMHHPMDLTVEMDAGLVHSTLDSSTGLQSQQLDSARQPLQLGSNTINDKGDDDMVHRLHRDDILIQKQQQQQQQKTPAKSNWILQTTEDGSEVYYYNVVTKEMRYSLPANAQFDDSELPPTSTASMTSPRLDAASVRNTNGNMGHPPIDNNQHLNNNSMAAATYHQPVSALSSSPTPTTTFHTANPAITDEISLPPHWVRKVDTKGRVYFCNLLTDETTWNLDQIDPQTGNLNTIHTPRTHDTAPNASLENHQENQPLSWNQLSTLIAHAIHALKNSIKQGHVALLRDDAIMVVHRIRLMLYVSNTVDKESSPHLKSNKPLRVYHRALLASLAKTVLSTKAASGTWSQDDALHKLQMDADQLLVDVRNFLSAAQDLRLDIYDDKPRLVMPDLGGGPLSLSSSTSSSTSSSSMSNGHRWRIATSTLANGTRPDPSTTLLVLADNIRGAMSSFMESVHNAFSSLDDQASAPNTIKTTAPLLVAQFRNLSNTASQFLNAVDDLSPHHLSQQQHQQQRRGSSRNISIAPTNSKEHSNAKATTKGYPPRQTIYNAMGLLFIASQTITNSDLPIAMIKVTYRRLEECIYEIEKSVQSICLDVTTAAASANSKPNSTRGGGPAPTHNMTPTMPASRPDTLFEQDTTGDIVDQVYADDDLMGGGHGFVDNLVHPTAVAAADNSQPSPPFHSPPSSANYPPSSSSSSYYHPHQQQQAGHHSPSLFRHDDDDMEANSFHSSNNNDMYGSNGELLSPAISATSGNSGTTLTRPPPKDKLAKFFGEDTLLAAKRRDTVLGNGAGPGITTTSAVTSINTGNPTHSPSNSTGLSATTPTTATSAGFGNTGSSLMAMGNEKPEYLCADYKQNEIIFNMEGNVKGGTVIALVQRLTQHDQLDSKFITTFLLTYRSFCTTEELFDALFARYTLQPPPELSGENLEMWNEKKLKLVRLRVFNVIKSWLDSYYIEEEDRVMLPTLLSFSENVIRESMRFGAEQLGKVIQKRMDAEDSSQLRKMTLSVRTNEMPPAILPKNMKRLRFLEIDPLELARQLTVMDSKLYSQIKPVECLDKNWGRADSQHTAANVKASIEYSNQVTAWVTDSILCKEELKKRSAVVKHWIYVAEKCRLLHNYNTCMAILSAFDNSSVGRLKRTWETMSARTTAILTGIRRLMGANRNFTEYRDIIHKVNPPCIPFLGIYLQDLTFIEDGNSNFLKKTNNLINFAKRMKTADVIRELQQYQSTPYILQTVPDIQEFIITHLQSSRDEETLYNLSLAVEPRERGEDTIARRLKESGL